MSRRKESSGWWRGFDRVLEAYMTWEIIIFVVGLLLGGLVLLVQLAT